MKIKNISFVLILLLFGLVGRVYALEKVEVPSDSEEVSQAAKHENPKTQLSVKSNQGIDVIDVSLNSQQDATIICLCQIIKWVSIQNCDNKLVAWTNDRKSNTSWQVVRTTIEKFISYAIAL